MNQYILCNRDKVPVGIDLRPVDPHDPTKWMSEETARSYAETLGLHVGFVFTESDPYFFIDIDHAVVNGQWSPIAQQLMEVFTGCFIEVSISGTGLHIFGRGQAPEHSSKNKEYGIEFYTEGRFALLTGTNAVGSWEHEANGQLPWLVDSYFPPKKAGYVLDWSDQPVPEWNGPTDDAVLIEKMRASRGSAAQILGGKASVADLFDGNVEVLAQNYPPINPSDPYDRSSADAALANHLAFWTGKNHSRIWNLMWQSALRRPKWEKHKNYLAMTITNAVQGCNSVYGYREPIEVIQPTQTSTLEPIRTTGHQFLSPEQQIEYFKDCVYIRQMHGVLTPNGEILKPDQFRALYSGYTFSLTFDNSKTTKSAWEAFIDNQAVHFPRVDGVCFRPKLPPYTVVREEGLTLVNTYVPLEIRRTKGDVSLFLDHMKKLFPNDDDREIILAYMAAIVQHQGIKFQWCPIIVGAEGNGKTLLDRCIAAAVGLRYTHYPNASELSNNGLRFNGWVLGKVFIGIEEIFVSDRRELTEPLKVFVTNEKMEIQFKGRDQFTGDNIANIIMHSNHKDCMKITVDQRRYWMYYCPQQTARDLYQDGLDGLYFKKIYDWLKLQDGYAMVAEYLWTYPIPDHLNPADQLQRAPRSSSTDEAIANSMGLVEQSIIEAVDEGRMGFCGDYVSSTCLMTLLKEMKLDNKIAPRRRNTIMESLGYQRHPLLANGRVNNPVSAEGNKPILYYRGHVNMSLTPAEVQADYEAKQGYKKI